SQHLRAIPMAKAKQPAAPPDVSFGTLMEALHRVADVSQHPNRHYHGPGEVLGVRMGTLFDIAKQQQSMPLAEVHKLLDESAYEARLAGFCILDFQVRRRNISPS